MGQLAYTITFETWKLFDKMYEVREVFLDIWKALGKVWVEVLFFIWKQNGVTDNKLLINFESSNIFPKS